jgi:hypothetical protein
VGYALGFELIVLNGAITFGLLLLVSKKALAGTVPAGRRPEMKVKQNV